ncbi:MAG: imidazolonepropionase [Candidatus Neomarinimicrobiota bacterium]
MIKLNNIGQCVTYNSILDKMDVLADIEIIIQNDKIVEIGHNLKNIDNTIDCKKMLVTPGFVDSHTHPVFWDTRENEFQLRLQGYSYEEIALSGGGINSSVDDLRKADESDLIERLKNRMNRFLQFGTTTIECKSGYGLSVESELKSLKAIYEVDLVHSIDMIPTFMGAHAFPKEYKNNHNGYVDLICNEMIPEVSKQGIAIFNDVFCENGYFDIEQTRRILLSGLEYGLIPRLHADELQDSNSAQIAGELKAITADHLMMVNNEGIEALSKNKVIATLLPGTTFFLGKKNYAPYLKLINSGIEVALATDYNPGSCNIQSMPFIVTLACLYLKMNILDAIKASTYISSKSLKLEDKIGSLEEGKKADIIIWNINKVEKIPYFINYHPIKNVLKNGVIVFTS